MAPGTLEALTVLALAIAPGFVAVAAWARTKTWKGPSSDLRTILQSLVVSAVIQILVAPLTIVWILPVRESLVDEYPERLAVWLAIVVIVVPLAGGLVAGRLTDYVSQFEAVEPKGWRKVVARVRPAATPPTIWDWLFTTDPPDGKFMLIEFKDGTRVAGSFSQGSVALTSPEPHGIFLASEWTVNDDGDIVEPRPGSSGALISNLDEVRVIRILESQDDE